ncbi:MAG TPA: hypothetical protein VK658_16620 [Chryseolinea sp.]|nr:hypothetical protein [Chryseolinea sp.]
MASALVKMVTIRFDGLGNTFPLKVYWIVATKTAQATLSDGRTADSGMAVEHIDDFMEYVRKYAKFSTWSAIESEIKSFVDKGENYFVIDSTYTLIDHKVN